MLFEGFKICTGNVEIPVRYYNLACHTNVQKKSVCRLTSVMHGAMCFVWAAGPQTVI